MEVTLVLPGRGRSGGVRATVEMARMLLSRGYRGHIVAYRPPVGSERYFKERILLWGAHHPLANHFTKAMLCVYRCGKHLLV